MVFSSFTFIAFFLPLVTVFYFLSKKPLWRNAVLTVFSLLFYAWGEPRLVILMLLSITVNYVCALMIARCERKAAKTFWMILGVGISLGALFYYKYSAFIANSLLALFKAEKTVAARALPIGISFYTFQIITYTVDVFRGKVPAQKSYLNLAMYISFFPQLIAGPIVNYTYVEPQLAERKIIPEEFFNGAARFFIGLGKKVIIANTAGNLLSYLSLTGPVSMLSGWLGAVAYSLQIYFDFSGYSDMAIGLGHMFGFHFTENFNYPYISSSVTEFWRRWHISLGAFFRDYVYIPLGGNRVSTARHIFNLLVVWSLTGLWHGASWNFIVWGAYYGILLILEKYLLKDIIAKTPSFIRHFLTLLAVVLGWVLFYHENIADGIKQISAMLYIGADGMSDYAAVYALKEYLWVIVIGAAASVPWKPVLRKIVPSLFEEGKHAAAGTVVKTAYVTAVYILSLIFLAGSGFNPFLYFRF